MPVIIKYCRNILCWRGGREVSKKSLTPQVVMPLVVCYLELRFFPSIHCVVLQCHLTVPVKAGQELPCRMQAAHPQCGTSLGINKHAHTHTHRFLPCHFQLFYRRGEKWKPLPCLYCSICPRLSVTRCQTQPIKYRTDMSDLHQAVWNNGSNPK